MRQPESRASTGRGLSAARVAALSGLFAVVAWVVASYLSGGIIAIMSSPQLAAAEKLEELRRFFTGLGAFAPLAYVAVVTAEVVIAPIPGTVLYAPAGVVFGGFWGGALSLIGNVTGAALSFALMRALGRSTIERFIETEQLQAIERRLVENGVLIVFLLRLNPLTSSDIVSYAAGGTSMPLRKLLLGTTLGMAPLCFLQAYLAEGLLDAFPGLVYPLLVAGALYAAVFVWVIFKSLRRQDTGSPQRGPAERAGAAGPPDSAW